MFDVQSSMLRVQCWMFRLPPSAPWWGERAREPDSKSVGQASRLSPSSTFGLQHSMFDARRVAKRYAVQARVLIVERASFARGSGRCPSPIGCEKVSVGRLRVDQMRVVREKQFIVRCSTFDVECSMFITLTPAAQPGLPPVQRAFDPQARLLHHVQVNHRRRHILVSE